MAIDYRAFKYRKRMHLRRFKLRFPTSEITRYASQYSYGTTEELVVKNAEVIKQRGYMLKSELELIAYWKTPRSKHRISSNSESLINEVTNVALSTPNEMLRINMLMLLDGVGWPTASTILHFYHIDRYPILDYRVLFSLSCENVLPRHYNFNFWNAYTLKMRMLSEQTKLSMRVIDKGLWQFSKVHQKSR